MAVDVSGRWRVPDFIIGGAPRTGTTWLYCLLDRHPSIAMAKPLRPEPKFFLVDELYARGIEYYCSNWFSNLPADRIYGEKSTNYLEDRYIPSRIRGLLPNVKLIFVLRDPIDRAYSNFRFSRSNGLEQEVDFARALELESERETKLPASLRYARPHAYFSRGLYAQLLQPYFSLFPADRLLVLRHEDIAISPQTVASRVHAFLGVAPRPQDLVGLGKINMAPPTDVAPLSADVRVALSERYREPNQQLAELLGPSFEIWGS
jgi:hypothetical protein